ncbi:hypothetical protein GTY86_35780 [Streptomyces sp. SID5770]|uniref:hypothetical protein n=1 Tax=Streptomyces sp. SID5770 TaxID=2690308 RepID=UPI00136F7F8B|nr:hypothetical protein [Streptomyces sp. SID5770]MZE53775.1 hypothetical protein [Streptomyces sp. SID5770]MZE56536.1 hypothetical protein [Streptomyces sp. SID5770]
MTAPPFSLAAARERLGADAVAAIERAVAAAPPLRAEQREQIRAVFATARPRQVTAPAVPAPRAA